MVYDGTVKTYEDDYRKLIQRTKKHLPKVLVICEPFVSNAEQLMRNGFTNSTDTVLPKKITSENHTVFVPFQSMFDDGKMAEPAWAGDGVHPSPTELH